MSTTLKKELKQFVGSPSQKLTAVRVIDIILNISHPKAIEFGGYDSIGTIFYTILEDNTPLEEVSSANIARPIFSNLKHYPLKNEIVLILSSKDKELYNSPNSSIAYYFPTLNIWNHPHHNALPTVKGLSETSTEQDYEKTEAGIIRKVTDEGTGVNLGKYFQEALNIKPLLPYEGDYIIEGRFGNSIRLGSTNIGEDIPDENNNNWSSTGNTGDPITIIRNGQSNELDDKGWVHTIEDINNDLTSLYLTSNQQLSNFRVASTNFQSYQAKLELPQSDTIILTDPQLNVIVDPEFPEEDPSTVSQLPPIPTEETTVLTSPTNIEEVEGDKSPFDLFMSGSGEENFSIQEIEGETENQEITPTSYKVNGEETERTNPNNVETDITGPVDLSIKIGKYHTLEDCILSDIARTGVNDGHLYIVDGVRLDTPLPYKSFEAAKAAGVVTGTKGGCNNLPGVDPKGSIIISKNGTSTVMPSDKDTIIANLDALFTNVVDKIYEKYAGPNGDQMSINSVYRSKLVNDVISNNNSNHLYGQAIDIQVPGIRTSEIFNWILSRDSGIKDFNQLIWEFPEKEYNNDLTKNPWIHIAYKRSGNRKRLTLATNNEILRKWNGDTKKTYSDMLPNDNLFADQSEVDKIQSA